ncbi:MAG: pyrimidine/purine nucleoside phosphorylase, partial [Verrucomicrobia bacterium]
AERMEIVAGDCGVVLDGSEKSDAYSAGQVFDVPANSGFTITVTGEPCHYICSFLDA